MGTDITVYGKMSASTEQLCEVLKKEIGVKACVPFAVRAVDSLKGLGHLTESEGRIATNTFLDKLQTLIMGGTITEDYDQIDMVKRGKTITVSIRIGGLIRAAARKGYRINATFVAVPKDSKVYFDETVINNEICYVIKDDHKNEDREITAERFIQGYFDKFLCRLEIRAVKNNARVAMTTMTMSNTEVMAVHNASDNGLFYSEWVGEEGHKKKIIKNGENGTKCEINKNSFWYKWTGEMIYKTVLRRAIKKVRDALPELDNTFYAFDEQPIVMTNPPTKDIEMPQIEIKTENVDIKHLTAEQQKEAEETLAMYKANPKMADDDANAIMREFFEDGKSAQDCINEHYAQIANLMKSKNIVPIIEPLMKDLGVWK
jgi:hypothetical protein